MSDYTKAQLKKLGWQEGDPIPGDLGLEIQRIQQRYRQERDEANWEENPPPGYRKPKHEFANIDDIPEEEQAKLREYLADYKEERKQQARQMQQQAQFEEQSADMSPQMREATARAMQQQTEAEVARGASMAASLGEGPPADFDIPEGKKFGGAFGNVAGMEKIQKMQQQAKPQKPPEPAPPEHDHAPSGIADTPVFCPRCLWDQREPFEIKPTQEDKEGFVAAILGMGRFEKEYELLNGNVKVYFRSLMSDEVAKLHEQLGWHIRRGEILGDGEYFMWLMEYRMCMATSRIETGGQPLKQVVTLEEFEKEHPDSFGRTSDNKNLSPTALFAMRDWFYKNVVTTEPVRRVIGQEHRVFQRLVEGLEALADKPDFWKGIGRPA